MRVVHLLAGGNFGGIEVLCRDFTKYSKHENIILLLWEDGILADEMRENGIEVVNIHVASQNIFQIIKTVIKFCDKRKAEVIIAQHEATVSHLCLMAIKHVRPQIKTIAYAHANAVNMYRIEDKKRVWIRKFIISKSLQNADIVVAISNSVKKSLIRCFSTPENKISVIYNGVDLSRFMNDSVLHNSKNIVFVGRLIEGKGVQTIIKALALINDSFHFHIVGDGPYRNVLEELTFELSLQHKVTFWGNRKNVEDFLLQAAIFIHVPILEEEFGITVVEAMAAGLICVCFESGGIPEIIEDKINGYLIKKNDPEKLAGILKDILENYNSRENIQIRINAVNKAKEFCIDNYSISLNAAIQEGKRLLYIGRLIPEKGVQTIIKAMYLLPKTFHLTIVGDGPYRKTLESLSKDIKERVSFLGTRVDIPQLLSTADIFVHMPEWEEGFGITVVEAMAAGKICIIANSGALPEIITDNMDGFIVEKGNVRAVANKIIEITDQFNSIKIQMVRKQAIKRAKEFSIERYCAKLDQLIMR